MNTNDPINYSTPDAGGPLPQAPVTLGRPAALDAYLDATHSNRRKPEVLDVDAFRPRPSRTEEAASPPLQEPSAPYTPPEGVTLEQVDHQPIRHFASEMAGLGMTPGFVDDAVRVYGELDPSLSPEQMVNAIRASMIERGHSNREINAAMRWARDFTALEDLPDLPPGKELAAIVRLAGDPRSEYYRGPDAEYFQGRHRELIEQGVQSKAKADPQHEHLKVELEALIKLSGNKHGPYYKGPQAAQLQARHLALVEKLEAHK